MSQLHTHLTETKRLESMANNFGMPSHHLLAHSRLVEKTIKQTNCIHQPEAKPFRTHGATGKVWECIKCDKVIDIETDE